jgi:hypothetical protein
MAPTSFKNRSNFNLQNIDNYFIKYNKCFIFRYDFYYNQQMILALFIVIAPKLIFMFWMNLNNIIPNVLWEHLNFFEINLVSMEYPKTCLMSCKVYFIT